MKRPLQLLSDPVKAGYQLAIPFSCLGEANACTNPGFATGFRSMQLVLTS